MRSDGHYSESESSGNLSLRRAARTVRFNPSSKDKIADGTGSRSQNVQRPCAILLITKVGQRLVTGMG